MFKTHIRVHFFGMVPLWVEVWKEDTENASVMSHLAIAEEGHLLRQEMQANVKQVP